MIKQIVEDEKLHPLFKKLINDPGFDPALQLITELAKLSAILISTIKCSISARKKFDISTVNATNNNTLAKQGFCYSCHIVKSNLFYLSAIKTSMSTFNESRANGFNHLNISTSITCESLNVWLLSLNRVHNVWGMRNQPSGMSPSVKLSYVIPLKGQSHSTYFTIF